MARVILSVFVEMLCITSPTYFPHYVVPHHVFPHYVVPHHVSRYSPCDVFPPPVVPHHVVPHHVFPHYVVPHHVSRSSPCDDDCDCDHDDDCDRRAAAGKIRHASGALLYYYHVLLLVLINDWNAPLAGVAGVLKGTVSLFDSALIAIARTITSYR